MFKVLFVVASFMRPSKRYAGPINRATTPNRVCPNYIRDLATPKGAQQKWEGDPRKIIISMSEKNNSDVKKSLVINIIFILLLIALFFVNRATGFLDRLVERL